MTLIQFAKLSIFLAISSGAVDRRRWRSDPSVAAWLVWTLRRDRADAADNKLFNASRRVLQRAGRIRV